jgi:transcriptional regulator with XRE-family HTH domain
MSTINASTAAAEKAKAEFSAHLFDRIREECDPTYRDLAQRSGVSKSTISRIRTEAHFPKWPTVRALLLALDVDEYEIRTVWKPRWVATKNVIDPRPPKAQHEPTGQHHEGAHQPVLRMLNRRRGNPAIRPLAPA